MAQGKSGLTGPNPWTSSRTRGFILMEVLVAMVLMEIGILALADLFVTSVSMTRQIEQQLQMFQVLRGELERIEQTPLNELSPLKVKTYTDFTISIRVVKVDANGDLNTDYRMISAQLDPKDRSGMRDSYEFITYRTI